MRFFDTFFSLEIAKISIFIVNSTSLLENKDWHRKIYIGVIVEESEVQPECRKNEEDLKVQVGPKKEVKVRSHGRR